jgi:hypothetical protein
MAGSSFLFMKHFSSLLRGWLVALLMLLWLAGPRAWAQAPAWTQLAATSRVGSLGNYSTTAAAATDASGNVYLVGSFAGTVSFGSTTLTSAGLNDIFVAKWSPASNAFLWAQRGGGTDDDVATGVAVSGGNAYIIGNFRSSIVVFGGVALVNTVSGSLDVFVTKLTDAGTSSSFVWAQQAGGASSDDVSGLAVNGSDIYISGRYQGGSASFGSIVLPNAGPSYTTDIFVAKLTDAGPTASFIWAQRAGGTTVEYATGLAVNGTSIYLVGSFASPTATFGTLALTNTSTGTNNYTDAFVAKLTDAGSSGSFIWVQQSTGANSEYANAVTVTGNNVYVTGGMISATTGFGSTMLQNANISNTVDDTFLTKLVDSGPTGSFAWAQRSGGPAGDVGLAIAVRGTSIYLTGYFQGTSTLWGTSFPNIEPSGNTVDGYIARIIDSGLTTTTAWVKTAGGINNDFFYALLLSGTTIYVAGGVDSGAMSFGSLTVNSPGTGPSWPPSPTPPSWPPPARP